MSFDVDLDGLETEKSLREQVEDQLEDNGFTEEETSDKDFEESMDEFYGENNDDDEENEDEDNNDEDDETSDADSATANKNKAVKDTDDNQTQDNDSEIQRKEFGDRANKRIRELNALKKQALEEAESARKSRFEAEKSALETRKELTKLKIKDLKRDFESAINDGDASKQVEINAELAKLGADISKFETEELNYKEYKPQVKEQVQSSDTDVFGLEFDQEKAGKLANDWEFDNPRVLTDKVFADTSIKIGQQLMQRGFKPDSDKFYSELTKRLNMAFGISSQPTKENETNTNETTQKTDGTKVVVAKKNPPQKVQTVAGASRTPAPTTMTGQPASKNGIRLEKDDIELARQLGVDLKTYAANRARVEKSINSKGQIKMDLFGGNE